MREVRQARLIELAQQTARTHQLGVSFREVLLLLVGRARLLLLEANVRLAVLEAVLLGAGPADTVVAATREENLLELVVHEGVERVRERDGLELAGRVRVRRVRAERRRDGRLVRLVVRRDAHLELDLATRLVVEVDRVSAEAHQADEVDDLAGEQTRVPGLERARRDTEEVDALRDRDDEFEFRDAGEARAEAGVDDLLEVAPERFHEFAVLGDVDADVQKLVLVVKVLLVRVLLHCGRRPRVGLETDDAVDEKLDDAVERAVCLLRKPVQAR